MIVGIGLLLALLSVPLAGGHLTRAADLRFTAPWVIGLALLIHVVIIGLVPAGSWARPALNAGTFLLALGFLALNRHIQGLKLLMLGVLLNAIVIGLNGGVMPANRTALRAAGIDPSSIESANSAPRSGARLAFMGDVFAVPDPIPLHNVFSVGDVLIILGAGAILHIASDSRLTRRFAHPAPV